MDKQLSFKPAVGFHWWAFLGCWWLCSLSLPLSASATQQSTATAKARTFYVAEDGKLENDGSQKKPWPSVEVALAKTGAGQIIVVRPGAYRGPINISKAYAGTRERPTIIRSEVKWKAVIVGALEHGISNRDDCDWCVIDGFEVLGARLDGIKMNGNHDVVRNCWVHNNGCMGIAMHDKTGGVIENNLIEFNGCHVQLHHGVYASGDRLTIRGNIVRHNACFGLHLYPSIKDSLISNNLVHGHSRRAGMLLSCPPEGGKNLINNNTIADNAGAIEVWQGAGEIIVNNILVCQSEPLWFDARTRAMRVDHNLCVPGSTHQGKHGLKGDPLFVDALRGAYWLKAGSPAIGKGSRVYAPAADFWGRLHPKDRPQDIGCFAFVPSLTQPEARSTWHFQYAYRFALAEAKDMPDLWLPP